MQFNLRSKSIFALFLVTLCYSAHAVTYETIQFSAPAGVYNHDILLSAEAKSDHTITYRFKGTDARIQTLVFDNPIRLSAAAGETRHYLLDVQVFKEDKLVEALNLSYIVDKTPPMAPEPKTDTFVSQGPIEVEFSLSERDSDAYIRLQYQGSDGSSRELGSASPLRLEGKKGIQVSYEVTVFAEDKAKNRSPAHSWTYAIDRRSENEVSEIPVLSPVEGSFQNFQFLFIDSIGFVELKYTTDGSEPQQGRVYHGGTPLNVSGRIVLRIWGKTKAGREIEKRLVYECGTQSLPAIENEIIYSTKTIPAFLERLHYATGERAPTVNDPLFDSTLQLAAQKGTSRGLAVRLMREKDKAQFRYYFVLDGRIPSDPHVWIRSPSNIRNGMVTIRKGDRVNGDIEIHSKAFEGARIWYGFVSKPSIAAGQMKELSSVHRVSLSEIKTHADADGTATLQFQTRFGDSDVGQTLLFPISTNLAQSGELIVKSQRNSDGSIVLSVPNSSSSIWYTVESIAHEKPSSGPFRLENPTLLSVPLGLTAQFSYRFFVEAGERGPGRLETYDLTFLPPQEPSIVRGADGLVRLSGPGTIYYRVSVDKKGSLSTTVGFVRYSNAFELKAIPDENALYTVETYQTDVVGNTSPIARIKYAVHTKPPRRVRLLDGEAEQFKNTSKFSLQIADPEPNVKYHYTIGLPGVVPDPSPQSIWGSTDIQIAHPEARARLELRILGVSAVDPNLVGAVSRFYVSIDTALPSLPMVKGVEDGKSYNAPVAIQLVGDPATSAQYLLRSMGTPENGTYVDYTQTIRIPAPTNSIQEWELFTRARNNAGSEVQMARPIHFGVDTTSPSLPILKTSGSSGQAKVVFGETLTLAAANDLDLTLDVNDDVQVYYEMNEDLSRLRKPDKKSPRFIEGQRFSVPAGEEKTWYLQYVATDKADNKSPVSATHVIIVDKKIPLTPRAPRIIRQGNRGELIWRAEPGTRIKYSTQSSEVIDRTPPFVELSSFALPWTIPPDQEKITVQYRAVDAVGNESEDSFLVIESKKVAPPAQIRGVSDGGIYHETIIVTNTDSSPGTQLRYELSMRTEKNQEVSAGSTLFGNGLEISPVLGETVAYQLSVRQFAEGLEPSETQTYRFTIDAAAPNPPRMLGFEPGVSWIQESASITFPPEEGVTVWYAVQADTLAVLTDAPKLSEESLVLRFHDSSFVPFTNTLELGAKSEPSLMRYIVAAYSKDEAGNKSPQTRYWQIFMDSATVYVSEPVPAKTSGIQSGSRSQPFYDLETAIVSARKKNRNHIVLTSGKFGLSRTLDLSGLSIEGGKNPETWDGAVNPQTIVYPLPTFGEKSLFTLRSGKVTLRQLYVTDAGKPLNALVLQLGGELSVDLASLAISQSEAAIISDRSKLTIVRSTISASDPRTATLLKMNSTSCSIQNVVMENSDLPLVLQKNIALAKIVIISALDSQLVVQDSTFLPRRGASTTALLLGGGNTSLKNCQISTGTGAQGALAIDASHKAALTLQDCRINGEIAASNTILVRLVDAKFTSDSSTLNLNAERGAYGIFSHTSEVVLVNNEIIGGQAQDFITMISAEQTNTDVRNTRFKGASTRDFHIGNIRGGKSTWYSNSTHLSGVDTGKGAGLFSFSSIGMHEFSGNNFVGNELCTLFYTTTPEVQFTIRNNILEGWQLILQEGIANPLRQSQLDEGISTIQDLERLKRQGSLFEGNKVRQGL